MQPDVLLISTMPDAGSCADAMSEQLRVAVELAHNQRQALTALKRTTFSVVVIEESLAERDPDWAEAVWLHSGMAVPLELSFAISARTRLFREVRTTLARLAREMAFARKEAAAALESQLKGSVTGLLLQTQLTLKETNLPSALVPKLKHLVDLASDIRERLRQGL